MEAIGEVFMKDTRIRQNKTVVSYEFARVVSYCIDLNVCGPHPQTPISKVS